MNNGIKKNVNSNGEAIVMERYLFTAEDAKNEKIKKIIIDSKVEMDDFIGLSILQYFYPNASISFLPSSKKESVLELKNAKRDPDTIVISKFTANDRENNNYENYQNLKTYVYILKNIVNSATGLSPQLPFFYDLIQKYFYDSQNKHVRMTFDASDFLNFLFEEIKKEIKEVNYIFENYCDVFDVEELNSKEKKFRVVYLRNESPIKASEYNLRCTNVGFWDVTTPRFVVFRSESNTDTEGKWGVLSRNKKVSFAELHEHCKKVAPPSQTLDSALFGFMEEMDIKELVSYLKFLK